MSADGISVVTTTWNERKNIKRLVPAVRNVLQRVQHEIIVVDDSSPDGTFQAALRLADVAVSKRHEGQSQGLLHGLKLAKYPVVITIDADMENPPAHMTRLARLIDKFDVIVASRTTLPRFSEKLTSQTLGRIIGVSDVFSNFRAYQREAFSDYRLRAGETFGAELLVAAKKRGLRIGEIRYEPPTRRKHPRIGGTIRANVRILQALVKAMILYLN
ncbi:MAG: glycosyltransferase [Candidatus Bathyarchaeia archaeon]